MKTVDLYKGGRVFFYCPPDKRPVEMVVLMREPADGPLCVARVWDHNKGEIVDGLYWLYLIKHGAHLGPFFADIHLAFKAMRKIVRHFGSQIFDQPLEWIRRQASMAEWIGKNIGWPQDLLGGEWRKDTDKSEDL